jgi:prepilin-type N-terminal cleavage/methylation domain-containing protein
MCTENSAIREERDERPTGPPRSQDGFSLLEVVVAMALVAIAAAIGLQCLLSAIDYHRLLLTRDNVLWGMRWCQQKAVTAGTDTNFRFSMYTPQFSMYVGPDRVFQYAYPPGVNYKDGYLQLQTGNIRYSPQGSSQVGGNVQLVAGAFSTTIHLFLGSGLQTEGESP